MKKVFLLILIFISFLVVAKEKRELFKIYIKPNAPMKRLSDGLFELAPKGFIANALEVDPVSREEFYIYTKEGKAKYIIDSNYITEIEDDLNLYTNETGNKIYPPKSLFRSSDKTFNFESEFSFHVDQLDLSPLNDFLQNDINNIFSPRYKINTHYISKTPVNVGFNLNLQSSSWRDQNQTSSDLNILSFGPELKFKIITQDEYELSSVTSFEFCPSYNISTSTGKDTFSSYIWGIGINNQFETRVGKINASLEFRKHYLTLNSTTRSSFELKPNEYVISSLGLSIGYKFDWEL